MKITCKKFIGAAMIAALLGTGYATNAVPLR